MNENEKVYVFYILDKIYFCNEKTYKNWKNKLCVNAFDLHLINGCYDLQEAKQTLIKYCKLKEEQIVIVEPRNSLN